MSASGKPRKSQRCRAMPDFDHCRHIGHIRMAVFEVILATYQQLNFAN
jgi:hypothetical protein